MYLPFVTEKVEEMQYFAPQLSSFQLSDTPLSPFVRNLWRSTRYPYFSGLAPQVFNEIPQREVVVQRSTDWVRKVHSESLQAIDSFYVVNASGRKPSRFALCTTLNSCAKTLNLHLGLQIHACLFRSGFQDSLFLNSALVDFYAKCGAVVDARRVFDGMERHDQVSWTSIITGFSQNGCRRDSLLMFKEMLGTEIKPNCFTYVSVISACGGLEETYEGCVLLHTHVIKLGLDSNTFVLSSLIDCYSKHGKIDYAACLFNVTAGKDVVLFNSMISGYSQNLCNEEAIKLFTEMRYCNLNPTDHTLSSILNASGSLTVLQLGKQVHSWIMKMGSESSIFLTTALIDMYSKCGNVNEARRTFDETIVKNRVLWTSMITGYAQSGKGVCAVELFDRFINEEGYIPDHICFTAVLTACNHAGLLDKGIEYFNKMARDYGLVPQLDQYACLVDLYARNGHLSKAKNLIREMPYSPNSVIWSSILSSCKVYGDIELAREAAVQLFKLEPHNAASYVTMASIYAKAGLWGQVSEVRSFMQEKRMRKCAGWSWIEADKRVHVFSVGDANHPQAQEIYAELERLNLEMRNLIWMEMGLELEYSEPI